MSILRDARVATALLLAAVLGLGACATRPVNPPITEARQDSGYTFATRQKHFKNAENLVILAFSGGGTRAAAFSYGVLEYLRRTEVVAANGTRMRLIDSVDIITGVSGGSFTALAYGLYGEKLFDDYEQRFLKRNVQGEIIGRSFNPAYWGDLVSTGWGRSELAAQLYDEILFNGATFGDLDRGTGPLIMASATDISTGGRVTFQQNVFDLFCSDLSAVKLSRAAAASSAVPVVLSPVTINNYGGTCGAKLPAWMEYFANSEEPPRPASRAIRELHDAAIYRDSAKHPYVHLVDGGVSDNLGMRGVLDALSFLEALRDAGLPSPLDHVKNIVVVVVNSLSAPPTDWDQSEQGPGTIEVLLKASGVPIDHYSFEAVETLKDTAARWQTLKNVRELARCEQGQNAQLCAAVHAPQARIFAIDVSFAALKDTDRAEFDYLNAQPTSFVLPPEAVDRLRAAAGKIVADSPQFKRLIAEAGMRIVTPPAGAASGAAVTGGEGRKP
jgi:NTE family protein